jgi:glycosyltransferase involved in cell wall biosynthesis
MLDESRIAWFTPLRPVASGISNYNEELLGVLGRSWPIDVCVDGYRPEPFESGESLHIFSAGEFNRRDARRRYDAVVYQFGNSPAHAYMYDLALRRPGVVVLHDTMLHHLHLSMIGRRGGATRYRRMMDDRYGAAGLRVAERVLQGRIPVSLFDYPLTEDLIERALHVVVHSEFARSSVLERVPDARVSIVPMGIRLPPVIEQKAARKALDLDPDIFIVASVTLVNPHKRLDVVLRSLSRLRRRRPVQLLIAGNVSPNVPLDRWIALYGLTNIVEPLGYVDDRTARLVAAAADALVNLRFPTAGETSASLLRLMAAARPVLVSDTGSFQELPDDAVAKVPVDACEAETIEAYLDAFAGDMALADRLGRKARNYVEREHSLNRMVAGYAELFREVMGLALDEPPAVDCAEELQLERSLHGHGTNELIDSAASALLELGLAGHAQLSGEVARAIAELGVGPDKMDADEGSVYDVEKERMHERG